MTAADPWSDLLTSGFAEWSKLLGTSRDAAAPPDGDPLYRWLNTMWKANPLSALLPLEPGEMARAFEQLWAGWLQDPQRAMATYTELTSRSLEVVTSW